MPPKSQATANPAGMINGAAPKCETSENAR
jgi:hypothetical protein